MKVVIVGYIGWYGSMAEWVADGMSTLGHDVIKIDHNLFTSLVDNLRISNPDIDFYLFVDCSEDYSKIIPDDMGVPKVFWSMDAHMPGGLDRSVNIARRCEVTFCSNYEHGVKLIENFGIKSYLLPITYNATWVLSNKPLVDRKYDVVMIGHPNSAERVRLWSLLNDNFKCYLGKANTRQEYIDIMSEAKIVVNQPTEPWDTILNNRFFEALGFGSLLLQKKLKTNLIEAMGFRNEIMERDFVYWQYIDGSRMDTVIKKVKYYLNNPSQAQGIATKGYEKVLGYSMKNQCQKMINILVNNKII